MAPGAKHWLSCCVTCSVLPTARTRTVEGTNAQLSVVRRRFTSSKAMGSAGRICEADAGSVAAASAMAMRAFFMPLIIAQLP